MNKINHNYTYLSETIMDLFTFHTTIYAFPAPEPEQQKSAYSIYIASEVSICKSDTIFIALNFMSHSEVVCLHSAKKKNVIKVLAKNPSNNASRGNCKIQNTLWKILMPNINGSRTQTLHWWSDRECFRSRTPHCCNLWFRFYIFACDKNLSEPLFNWITNIKIKWKY